MFKKVYTADFESNNAEKNIEDSYTNVWLSDICGIYDLKHRTNTSIHDFFKSAFELGGGVFYFHNLKFDGQFILNYLLRNNFKYSSEKILGVGEFYSLISDRGVYYMIKACIGRYRGRRIVVEFRDSSKKINGSIEQIAIDYNLPIRKGDINYKEYHPKNYVPTANDIEYIRTDTEVSAMVLRGQYDNDMTHLTTSSDSLHKYKDFLHGNYRKFFPIVDIEIDNFFRKAYRGGVVQVNEQLASKTINRPIYCYDVNSMYPSVMVSSTLPYGVPKPFSGKPKPTKAYPLYIVFVEVCLRLKKGHRPTILRKNLGFKKIEYVVDTFGEMEELILTSVDFDLMVEHYDIIDIKYIRGYYFRGSKNLFKDFILPLYKTKCESKGAVKLQAKLILNSLYGKFGTNPKHIERIPYLDDLKKLVFKNGDTDYSEPEYTAMASFITAYARRILFDAIHENINAFVYCDTDSVHLTAPAVGLNIDDNALGLWALEKVYIKSKYLAQKTYIGKKENGSIDVKICGAPKTTKKYVTFDNFEIGATYGGKLIPRKVRGGVVLVDTTFTIKSR